MPILHTRLKKVSKIQTYSFLESSWFIQCIADLRKLDKRIGTQVLNVYICRMGNLCSKFVLGMNSHFNSTFALACEQALLGCGLPLRSLLASYICTTVTILCTVNKLRARPSPIPFHFFYSFFFGTNKCCCCCCCCCCAKWHVRHTYLHFCLRSH